MELLYYKKFTENILDIMCHCRSLYYTPGSDEHGPCLTGVRGRRPGGVAQKNGQGHMRLQRGVISYSPRSLSVSLSTP